MKKLVKYFLLAWLVASFISMFLIPEGSTTGIFFASVSLFTSWVCVLLYIKPELN